MDETTFIILGATGDLTKRKLLPAIARIIERRDAKPDIILVARRDVDATHILDEARRFAGHLQDATWRTLERATSYHRMEFTDAAGYSTLAGLLEARPRAQRIFYLATVPEHFAAITRRLKEAGLVRATDKVVYEKPFGRDLRSARALNRCVTATFPERQIYRIDHYLGKELVHNIALARFTNTVLEPLWRREHIDHVEIVLNERLGMEGRGAFYDTQGALRDVLQNHALQLLALVAMEPPGRLTGDALREEKARALRATRVEDVLLAQYDSYRAEPGVAAGSTTETFAALKLTVANRRWRGVPFFLKAGKGLAHAGTSIHIVFKHPACLLETCPRDANVLTIDVQPKGSMRLTLNMKVPNEQSAVTPVTMEFLHDAHFGANTPDAYEVLLEDCRKGEQALFVREDEIEESWRIIDAARRRSSALATYAKGSEGPERLDAFLGKGRWLA